jgi:hypothetical protein
MQDGALFRVEKVSIIARLALEAKIWDGSTRMCGIEASPAATVTEIVGEAQKRLNDEPLEDPKRYGMFYRNQQSMGPWTRSNYEFRPTVEVSGTVVVKSRTCDMTVPVPIFQKNRWQQLVYEGLPDPPFTVTQTGPLEFRAVCSDEVRPCKVRFITDGEGEEHEMNLFPLWENQKLKIQEAFGREMILDESRPSKDEVIYVKSADGSPPDPLFERILTYTLGDDPKEFKVRVRKGDTVEAVREGLKRLHPGANLEKMMIEDAEMADEDGVTEWATQTGSSDITARWTLGTPTQKFWLWKPSGTIDMGSEELDGRSREEIWRSLQRRNPDLREFGEYRPFVKQDEVNWSNLPVNDLTVVPTVIPVVERGIEFAIVNQNTVPRPREVGRLTVMTYQVFTIEKTPFGEPVQILSPNELSLSQLVTYFILPTGIQLDVGSVFYWNLEEVPDPSKADQSKRTLVPIPSQIPLGFNLRVKMNTLHQNSTKRMARCKYGSVPMCFAMPTDATVGRLRERVTD